MIEARTKRIVLIVVLVLVALIAVMSVLAAFPLNTGHSASPPVSVR